MPRFALGLGGNLGDVRRTFALALVELQRDVGSLVRVSRLYRTTPLGPPSPVPYLNAAAVLETDFDPLGLLSQLHRIEGRLGRVRTARWAPRTLDLDLLLYDDVRVHSAQLDVPHPGSLYRRFVLDPLAEIAPGWRHPETGLTIVAMRDHLRQRPLGLLVTGGSEAARRRVSLALTREFPDLQVTEAAARSSSERHPIQWLPVTDQVLPEVPIAVVPRLALNLSALSENDVATPVQLLCALLDEPMPLGDIAALQG